jgi:hypothetical protein
MYYDIDEKKVQHISEVDGQKVHLCPVYVKVSSITTLTNMGTEIILVASAAATTLT